MSWLSPKRRRTTGNLQTIRNGQTTVDDATVAGSSTNGSPPKRPPARPPGLDRAPSTPTPQPLRPSAIIPPTPSSPEGNLFYAYARRGDDVQSRFLLTFASANVANEWWSLLQAHYPDSTRPGPQLFSFREPDVLQQAWKHPAFAHLKTKWMYINFSDAKQNGLGGAAQGIIPVQDAYGNMLGGGAPASPELLGQVGQVRRETKMVRNELSKIEDYFEKMMEAVDRNTNQVARLAESQQHASMQDTSDKGSPYETHEISTHLSRINDLLARSADQAENQTKRQKEYNDKLQAALKDMSSRQRNDYLDMAQLSAHLDRIQSLMEQSLQERTDSAKDFSEANTRVQIDFSPLTEKLEKMQIAVEKNSALIQALLDEGTGAESKPGTPFWGKEAPAAPSVDLSPLSDHLQKIHAAIEQQSAHMQALIGFASGDGENGAALGMDRGHETAEKSLNPLGEHLEQIYNAIEEGNRNAMNRPPIDLEPLIEAQNATKKAIEGGLRVNLQPLIEAQNATRAAVERGLTFDLHPLLEAHHETRAALEKSQRIDLQPLIDAQVATKAAVEASSTVDFGELAALQRETRDLIRENKLDLGPLLEAQEATRAAVEAHGPVDQQPVLRALKEVRSAIAAIGKFDVQPLVKAQHATREAVEANGAPDFDQLADKLSLLEGMVKHVKSTSVATNDTNELLEQLLEGQDKLRDAVVESNKPVDFAPLAEKLGSLEEHLMSLREWAEFDSEQIKELVEAQKGTRTAAEGFDAAPLANKLDTVGGHLETLVHRSTAHEERLDELIQAYKDARDSEIDFEPLADHLEAIRSATADNGEHLQALLEVQQAAPPHSASADIDFSPLADRLNRIHASLERQAERSERSPGAGDPKFIMSALTSHLSKIQAVTEANAQHIKSTREKQSATSEKMQVAVASTSDAIAALIQQHQRTKDVQDARLEAVTGQVRELMAGQREMVEVMRNLAMSITAQNKGSCDHIVIPPPRKVSRKVVGFVYDAKEGAM